jgi:hypothetical protein
MHTLNGPTVKIVEKHLGRAFVQLQQVQTIQIPALPQQIGQPPQGPAIVPLGP